MAAQGQDAPRHPSTHLSFKGDCWFSRGVPLDLPLASSQTRSSGSSGHFLQPSWATWLGGLPAARHWWQCLGHTRLFAKSLSPSQTSESDMRQ